MTERLSPCTKSREEEARRRVIVAVVCAALLIAAFLLGMSGGFRQVASESDRALIQQPSQWREK